MTKLVIVESPSKAKTIKKYLGPGYEVKASKGHLVDLPKSDLGVNIESNFEPKYVVTKQAAVKELKQAFKDKDELILAVDPDREGEAIGWHVARQLGVITPKGTPKKGQSVKRIVFTEITESSIKDAINHPREIDMDLVDAQQARRVLDRLVGYKLSPLLWKKIRYGLSAGRVQSVAVRLIVEREEERDKFNPEEYWSIKAALSKNEKGEAIVKFIEKEEENPETSNDVIIFDLTKISGKKAEINNKSQAEEISSDVKEQEWKITNIEEKDTKKYPRPPFTTSTLQQAAANRLGYSAKKTMTIAQKLYEQGLITYMRTDSTNLSQEALDQARKYIQSEHGKDYLPEKPIFYRSKAKVAQEAHEAIRPTKISQKPGKLNLDGDEARLYALIWQRMVSSQMTPAVITKGKIEIEIDKYLFTATNQIIKFPGYLKVYPERITENSLPDLSIDDKLYLTELNNYQHFTQPPPRYSEASLIKALESYGIGRPSTYVPIISTIQTRKYVEKEGSYFKPTDTGKIVTNLLRDHFQDVVDYEFTAYVENELDDIANGKQQWTEVIGEFYGPFEKKIGNKDKEIEKEQYTVVGDAPSEIKCPDCGGEMNIKIGRYGRFYSCKRWPDCKGILGEDGKTEEDMQQMARSEDFLKIYKSAPQTEDGRPFLLKYGRYGQFWAHPDYPKVKDARPLEYTDEIFEQLYGKAPKTKDGKEMILRKGRFGEFWAHPDYPEKKEVLRINKRQIKEKKEELGIK